MPCLTLENPTLDRKTFEKFAALIYGKIGIVLGTKKQSLVAARLGKRMRVLGIDSYADYYEFVKNDTSGGELIELLNAISTNVTHFFREPRHFDVLGSLLKEWEKGGQKRFRLWCAASSSGEEPYSIAMTAKESLSDSRDARILATDIDTNILASARVGRYQERQMANLPAGMRSRYFARHKDSRGAIHHEVVAGVREMVRFGRINLASPPFALRGPLDVVFCRNVMIYFDNKVRSRLLEQFYRLLRPGGYLMVGHAESLSGILSEFRSVEPAVYIKE